MMKRSYAVALGMLIALTGAPAARRANAPERNERGGGGGVTIETLLLIVGGIALAAIVVGAIAAYAHAHMGALGG